MAIYRTIKYASMHREANFYAIVYNGRISAYEISGKDLGVSGFKRVTYAEFNHMMEEVKKRDNVITIKIEEKERKKAAKKAKTDMARAQERINKQVTKNNYKMSQSEWAWNYLPTV